MNVQGLFVKWVDQFCSMQPWLITMFETVFFWRTRKHSVLQSDLRSLLNFRIFLATLAVFEQHDTELIPNWIKKNKRKEHVHRIIAHTSRKCSQSNYCFLKKRKETKLQKVTKSTTTKNEKKKQKITAKNGTITIIFNCDIN